MDKLEAVPLHVGLSQHSLHPDREHAQIRSRVKCVSCLPSPQTCQTLKDIKEHKTYYTTPFSLVHSCSHAGVAVIRQDSKGVLLYHPPPTNSKSALFRGGWKRGIPGIHWLVSAFAAAESRGTISFRFRPNFV